jgi:hypothetical protein
MQGEPQAVDTDEVTLAISPEKVCFIIVKAQEFDAKDELTEPDPGSNPADDMQISVLEQHCGRSRCRRADVPHQCVIRG